MPSLLDQLSGGDLRTLGRSAAVATQVLADPGLIKELFTGIAGDDAVVMGRAIDALEKVTAVRPDLLQPYKKELLHRIAPINHWVVREHVCQLLPRLTTLTLAERRRALALVRGYLQDPSSVVKAGTLECLVRLSQAPGFARERAGVIALVTRSVIAGDTAAVRARARRLLRQLARTEARQ